MSCDVITNAFTIALNEPSKILHYLVSSFQNVGDLVSGLTSFLSAPLKPA